MPSEISVVAQRLIQNDSVTYFLNNCRLIYESFMPSWVQQPLVGYSSVEEYVIATFDMVQHLVNGQEIHLLILRFSYIHLVQVIIVYKATATKDRVEGQVSRGFGQRDITGAIDMHLVAKKKISKRGALQSEALRLLPSRQAIVLPRWTISHFSICILARSGSDRVRSSPTPPISRRRDSAPQRQNNSITDQTVQAHLIRVPAWGLPGLIRQRVLQHDLDQTPILALASILLV
jgi:hypothetical protein